MKRIFIAIAAEVCVFCIAAGHAAEKIKPLPAFDEETVEQELKGTPVGEIRPEDITTLRQYDADVMKWLVDAPDDAAGKQSALYPKLCEWSAMLHALVSTRKQTDAFKMIPLMAAVYQSKDTENKSDELNKCLSEMEETGVPLFMAAGAFVSQHSAKMNPATFSKLVTLFSVEGFTTEPEWEDLTLPSGPTDLMIIDPDAVVKQLEAAPWRQAQFFIGGRESPRAFFDNYDSKESNNPNVLKAKYAQNKALIDAKYQELVRWEWMKEYMPDGKHLKTSGGD